MKSLQTQKRLAAQIFKCSPKKIKLNQERLEDIKKAITKLDVKDLIKEDAIIRIPKRGTSKANTKKNLIQKSKGRRKGAGRRKGRNSARHPKKEMWMNNIRSQRKLLKELKDKDKIAIKDYRLLYKKAKGGFFRSLRHIKIYIAEHKMLK